MRRWYCAAVYLTPSGSGNVPSHARHNRHLHVSSLLRRVALRSASLTRGYVRLSFAGLAALCVCTHLRVLDVSMSSLVTDRGIVDVVTWCCALEELVLNKCHSVTDVSLHAVGQRCRRLRDLRVSWCKGVTDAGAVSTLLLRRGVWCVCVYALHPHRRCVSMQAC